MVVRPTESSDVTLTQSTHNNPSSSSSSKMASERSSTFKSSYGRTSTYDPPSSRFQSGDSSRQSRYDSYTTTSTTRSRVSSSVDRDVDSSMYKPLGRRAYSVDRDVSYDSGTKVRPWREKLKMAEQKRRAAERGELSSAVRRATSTDRGLSRSYSYESSTTTRSASPRRTRYTPTAAVASRAYDTYMEGFSSNVPPPRKSRAASMSRMGGGGDTSIDYEGIIASAKKRAVSVSRLEDDDYDLDVKPRRMAHPSLATAMTSAKAVGTRNLDVVEYNGQGATFEDRFHHHRPGQDISSFVLRPGEKFEPEHVNVLELPSGRKAMTYTTFAQYGHGDKHEANHRIHEVTQRTKILEQSVSTLEDFVRRNRSYFPEETTIYQQIRFYQLNQEQLREIGESPDAEVYGVKVREKLVVPPGTDVAHILSRYYKKSDVDVEYSTGGVPHDEVITTSGGGVAHRRRVPLGDEYSTYETASTTDIESNIRRQVEAEFDMLDKKRRAGQESYDMRRPKQEEYNHLRPHPTDFIHTVYRDAGASYDDLYRPPGSGASSLASPPGSDIESIRSSVSGKRRTYDQLPHFTAKLRNKQCISGQTIKFNCSVSGLPFPDIAWFRGNRVIDEGGRFTFSNNYGLLSLEITGVTKDDAGLYTVKAVNTEGEVACSASLDVIDLDYGGREGGAQKPYFTMEAANTAAEIEGRATFEARATGKPVPTFKWYRDNIPVVDSHRTKMYEDSAGNTKLVINDIRPEDSGLYFLTAENKAGKAKCAATLRVVERGQLGDERRRSFSGEPSFRRRSWSRDTTPVLDLPPRVKGSKPYFIQTPPVELKVREGEELTLKCMVDGDPKPVVIWARGTAVRQEQLAKVTWCKGVRELQYTERHRVVTEGDHYMMQIKQTTAYDRGQYIVVAENAVGRVHANCWVNVLPHGEPDDGDDIEFKRFKLDLPEFELEALTKGELGKQAPMFVQRLPRERTVSAGSSLELKCHVREATPEVVTATTYQTKTKGKVELQQETIKIGADGSVTKKTEVIDLEGKPPKPPKHPPAAAAAAAAAPATTAKAEEDASAAAAAPLVAPPSETEVAVPVVAMEAPEPPKAEEKEEVMEVKEVKEEVVQAVVVEKAPQPAAPAKEPSPKKSPSPEKSAPAPEPVAREPSPPPVKEEAIEPVSAEKVKEVKVVQEEEKKEEVQEKTKEKAEEEVTVMVVEETATEAAVVAMEVEATPDKAETEVKSEPMEVEEAKSKEEPMEVEKPAVPEPAPEVKETAEAKTEATVEIETKPSVDESSSEATFALAGEATSEETSAGEATFELAAEATSEATSAGEATFEITTEATSEATSAGEATFELAAEATSEATSAGEATFELAAEATSEETSAGEATFELPAEAPAEADTEAGEATFELPAETAPEPTPVVVEVKEEAAETKLEATQVVESKSEAKKKSRSSSPSSQPEPPSSPTSKEVSAKSESEGGLPVFVEKMRNIMLPEGATATFSCALNDNSNATAKWTKDGEELTSRTNVTVSAEGSTHTVTVSNVSKADEGSYTCTATNANGNATCSATLTVESMYEPC